MAIQVFKLGRKSSRVAPDPASDSVFARLTRKDPAENVSAASMKAWLSPLLEQQQRDDHIASVRKAARALASANSRKTARELAGLPAEPTPADAFPSHIIRYPDPAQPSLLSRLELVAVPIEGETFRVGWSEDSDEDADARRRRIYALNDVMRTQHAAMWVRYQRVRSRQMAALSKCILDGAVPRARWGLHRFAERCAWVQEDEDRSRARKAALIAAARKREAETLAKLAAQAADDERMLRSNEEMVQAMPEDPMSCAHRADLTNVRYCPWYNTVDGCKLHRCPLSHCLLPEELVTFKFRAWAFEANNGWCGERQTVGELLKDL